MAIDNHYWSEAERFDDLGSGSQITPEKIVIHYTAGSSLSGAINTLKSRGLSYNILIDVDGTAHQARPFNQRSSHAGRSNWKAVSGLKNTSGLNSRSIGISLVNLGVHGYFGGGYWWYGRRNGQLSPPKVRDDLANKHSSIYNPRRSPHWAPYTDEQLKTCRKIVSEIVDKYPSIDEIVGHDDIAIGYKSDPGPLVPVAGWREKFGKQGDLGLEAKVDSPDGELNLRDRPIYQDGKIIRVLEQNHTVYIRSVTYVSGGNGQALINSSSGRALTGWASVDVDGTNSHAGFLYMGYLSKNPLSAEYSDRLLVAWS